MPVHVLAKPAGAICNLDCSYCFYLDREELYPGARFRMRDEVLEAYLSQLLELHPGPEITIAWQGGEPTLLGVDFFRRAFEMAERLRRPGQQLRHALQTNATLLDDRWGELLSQYSVLVGVSIDGPAHLHDVLRVDRHGRGTHDRVRAGIEVLRRHQVECNALVTVNAANQHAPVEVYRYLRDELGFEFIQLIPIVEVAAAATVETPLVLEPTSVDPVAWGQFLLAVFREWLRADVGRVYVSMFDATLGAHLGMPASMCIFSETCGQAVALEHNGDLYSCDHFVDPSHLLGNLLETHLGDLVHSPAQQAFGAAKAQLPEQCRRCPVLVACRGECPKNRADRTVEGELGLNVLCAGYLSFFTESAPVFAAMAERLRRGGYADEVMALVQGAPAGEPCPCGSGIAQADCHGRGPTS